MTTKSSPSSNIDPGDLLFSIEFTKEVPVGAEETEDDIFAWLKRGGDEEQELTQDVAESREQPAESLLHKETASVVESAVKASSYTTANVLDEYHTVLNEHHTDRHLVICLDSGTANQFPIKNTNVVKLFGLLDKSDRQLAYYDSGGGEYLPVGDPPSWTSFRQSIVRMADIALAWNFDDQVKNAYSWLMNYYRPGDKIYLFGFSRGAYAVRALAGMVERVGLLPAGLQSQVAQAYEVYKSPARVQTQGEFREMPLTDLATKYRATYGISREVTFHFVGVWDTVSSLGGLSAPALPFASDGTITHFRQALALDERRAKFQPENRRPDFLSKDNRSSHKEVWFLGSHLDVGGSSHEDDVPALSNVPFRWMLWEAVKQGLRVDPISILRTPAIMKLPAVQDYLAKTVPEVGHWSSSFGPLPYDVSIRTKHDIRSNFSKEHRRRVIQLAAAHDSTPIRAGIHSVPLSEDDRLQSKTESLNGIASWVMEFVPIPWTSYKQRGNEWVPFREIRMHKGDGRYVQDGQLLHRSVQLRLLYDSHAVQEEDFFEGPRHVGYHPYPPIHAHVPPDWGFGMIDHLAAMTMSERTLLWEDTETLPAHLS